MSIKKEVELFLKEKPGYLKKKAIYIAGRLDIDANKTNIHIINDIKYSLRKAIRESKVIKTSNVKLINNTDGETVLVIGDIHEPFTLDGYLEFCKDIYDTYKPTKVIFIGDIIDNHFMSFHPSDPDGFGAGEELDRAIHKIQKWYAAFPEAVVIVGNHDRLAYRKAFAGGVSSRWIRDYDEVLGTPNWVFTDSVVIDNVLYVHGETGTARTKAKDISMSTVQGHLHSQAYIEFINNKIFAMQVGTGVDDKHYAFAYNKHGKESIISCGLVIKGKQPILFKKEVNGKYN